MHTGLIYILMKER